jgi:hypothetical protein
MLLFVLFYVLFVCKCVMYYCHRETTQLQLTNILYHIYVYEHCICGCVPVCVLWNFRCEIMNTHSTLSRPQLYSWLKINSRLAEGVDVRWVTQGSAAAACHCVSSVMSVAYTRTFPRWYKPGRRETRRNRDAIESVITGNCRICI